MNRRAQVFSIDQVRQFRAAMVDYEFDVRDTLALVSVELRRALDWIEQQQAGYWPSQMRQASDHVVRARNDLERCETAVRAEDRKSCMVEKKALEKAKRRLRFCEKQVQVAQKWRRIMQQEADELQTRLYKMQEWMDRDSKQALARLDRIIVSLEQTAQIMEGPATPTAGGSSNSSTSESDAPASPGERTSPDASPSNESPSESSPDAQEPAS